MTKRAAGYTQCTLRKGTLLQVAYIPSVFAKPGAVVKLRGEDGWQVVQPHQTDAAETVEAHQMDYRKQRRASDI